MPREGAGSGSGDILIYTSKKHQIYRLCTAPVSVTSRAHHHSQLLVPRHDLAGEAACSTVWSCDAEAAAAEIGSCLLFTLRGQPDRVSRPRVLVPPSLR